MDSDSTWMRSLTFYYLAGTEGWEDMNVDDYVYNSVLIDGTVQTEEYELPGGTCDDGLTWTYKNGILTISGTGDMTKYDQFQYPWSGYASNVTDIIVEDGVTSIRDYAFCSFSHLKRITLGMGISYVGSYAFQDTGSAVGGVDCLSIDSTFTSYSTDFLDGNLKTLYIGENFSSTGNDSTRPHSVSTMCDAIGISEEIIVAENNPWFCSVDGVVFSKDKTLLAAYPRLGKDTVYAVPEGVETIVKNAFYSNPYLQEISLPDSVLAIREKAFMSCTALEKLTLSNKVQTIESSVFACCTALKELVIPASVTSIGNYAFTEMSTAPALEPYIKIYFMGDYCAWGTDVLYKTNAQVYYMEDADGWTTTYINKLINGAGSKGGKKYVVTVEPYLPASGTCGEDLTWTLGWDGTLRISGTGAMEDYTQGNAPWYEDKDSIKKVEIEEGVTTVGSFAFYNCTQLTEADLPDSLISIGTSAFENCTALTSIVIPDGVTAIGDYAFGDVTSDSLTIIYPENDESWENAGYDELGKLTIGDNVSLHQHSWTTTTIEATCASDGLVTKTCSCGETVTETIPALGHSWDSGVITTPATCTVNGVKTFTCSNCKGTKTESVAAGGHEAAATWTETKAATCSSTGTKVKKCKNCGEVVATASIAKLAHTWGAWVQTAAATVFEPKHEQRTCSVCKTTASRSVGGVLTPTITLNMNSIPLKTGQSTTKVTVTGLANGDYVKSCISSNTDVFTASFKNGTLTITAKKKTGTAYLTITLASKKTAKVTVKVQKNAVKTTSITITGSAKRIVAKGKTLNLAKTLQPVANPVTSLQKITYSSSNKKVATVNASGVVTAKKAGTAKITIKSGSAKKVITITVPKTKTTNITGVPTSLTLKKGQTRILNVKAVPANSDEKITYKTSNKKIASITSKGKIKGVKAGTATITVTSGSIKKTFKVTVE